MTLRTITVCAGLVILTGFGGAAPRAQMCERIMEQDSTLNNLVHPAGYTPREPGTLGDVEIYGTGPQAMLLIPGLGFGADVFEDFAGARLDRFTMYAVTLAGMDGTSAPPMPPAGTSYGEQTWTSGALHAIERLIEEEELEDLIVVGHWLTGTQLAIRLAIEHPERVQGVVIISGSTRFTPTDTTRMPYHPPLEWRVIGVDKYLAGPWFKTVTRETWDDNNFLPGDYSVDPVRGLRLWREAARPELQVWVRYLCEFSAQDISLELERVEVPMLVLIPGLEGLPHDAGNNYLEAYCRPGWDGDALTNSWIKIRTVPETRVFMWYDQPDAFNRTLDEFLAGIEGS